MRRAVVVFAVVVAALVAAASPAAAHGGPGGDETPATNYRTRVLDVSPVVDGIEIRVIEAGGRLELVNNTGQEATVLGYGGEPYLRVGPEGVFENVRSPATYLNQDRYAEAPLPEEADVDAEPEWRRVDGTSVARWHDHRAHWMGGADPPAVAQDPDAEHVVIPEWEVPIVLADDTEIAVTGDLTWIPGPSPIPWFLAAAALLGLTVFFGRSHGRPVVTVALVLLAIAVGLDTAGLWAATSEPGLSMATALVAPLACALIGTAGWSQMRRNPDDALILVGAAGAGFALLFGVFNLDWLSRSQLPTDLRGGVARASVVINLGLGTALVVLGLRPLAHRVLSRSSATSTRSAAAPPSRAAAPVKVSPEPTPAPAPSLRHYRIRLLSAGLALLVAGGVISALFERNDSPAAGGLSDLPLAHDQLCLAVGLAADGNRADAEAVFFADVHRPLHTLAQEAAAEDREVAGRLLRAKQGVEAARITDPDSLADALQRLVAAAQDAVELTTGSRPPDCPTQEAP